MTFAHPGFLWGLMALAIPLIIHLFDFRRTKTIYFSNTRLLRLAHENNRRQRNLLHILVLIARMLFIFFLVMAFAQPFLPATESDRSGKFVAFYLDNSLSLSVPMPDKARAFDHGAVAVQEVVSRYPRDTRFRLLTNDGIAGRSYRTGQQVRDQVAATRIVPTQRNFPDIRSRLADEFQPEIFFISDFQKSSFPDLENLIGADTSVRWSLVPVQPEPARNLYVDSAAFENPYLIRGEQNRLQMWIRNDGEKAAEHITVRLTVGQDLLATASVAIPANATETITFDVPAGDRPQAMRISLQDFPVTYDNEFYLTYMPLRRLRVVVIADGDRGPYVPGVFGNADLFDLVTYDVRRIGYDRLDKADLVVLDGIDTADPALLTFAASRPEVVWLVIPSLSASGIRTVSTLTGLAVQGTAAPAKPKTESIAPPEKSDPFFRNVFDGAQNSPAGGMVQMPVATPSLSWGTDRSAILRFRDGAPFLSRSGNKFVMACPLDAAYTDLGSHALFVPLMYRLAAAARRAEHQPFYRTQARSVELQAEGIEPGATIRLEGPEALVAPQRSAEGKIVLDLSGLSPTPGVYRAVTGSDTIAWLAFNADSRESAMSVITASELGKLEEKYSGVRVLKADDPRVFSQEIKDRYLGTPLWKYAVWLALLFLLTEVLLLRGIPGKGSSAVKQDK